MENDWEYDERLSSDDRAFLKRYCGELGDGGLPDENETDLLLMQAAEGEAEAQKRLAARLLPLTVDEALEYAGSGLSMADLVQEGSLGLMTAVESLCLSPYMDPGSVLPYVRGEIRSAMEKALQEDSSETEGGEMVARRVNDLSDRIKELTEDLGEQLSIDELSFYLEMPAEEIESLIRLTGEGSDDEQDREAEG